MGSRMLDRDCAAEEARRRDLLATRRHPRPAQRRLRRLVAARLIRAGAWLHGVPAGESLAAAAVGR